MQCKVIIRSAGGNWTDEVKSLGDFKKTEDGYEISYKIAEDSCIIKIDKNSVVQRRKGDTNVEISFCKGKKTECKISTGGFSGGYEVITESVVHSLKKGGFRLELKYINGLEREKIRLTLTAVFTQEKL